MDRLTGIPDKCVCICLKCICQKIYVDGRKNRAWNSIMHCKSFHKLFEWNPCALLVTFHMCDVCIMWVLTVKVGWECIQQNEQCIHSVHSFTFTTTSMHTVIYVRTTYAHTVTSIHSLTPLVTILDMCQTDTCTQTHTQTHRHTPAMHANKHTHRCTHTHIPTHPHTQTDVGCRNNNGNGNAADGIFSSAHMHYHN